MQNQPHDKDYFDVVVCGAGLAGLSLARQLQLEQPGVSVALLDPHTRPLPEAAWKVGESSVEFGAHYYAEYLQLRDYLLKSQLVKCGLRFFFPGEGEMADRPENGLSEVAPILAYQLDRGILENDMREMVRDGGARLLEGHLVRKVHFGEAGAPHRIVFTDSASGTDGSLACRWVVDASGRRQLIQRQLKLKRPGKGYRCSAAWFRLPGRWDVDDLVAGENTSWHNRVPGRQRFFSTTHLVDRGYWVWLIPLSSDTTSIGIVARDDMHNFDEYNTYERALDWLRSHEPDLATYFGDAKPIDFLWLKDYSYSSERIFSADRWACVGEAAVFTDPFYSPGSDMIAIANTMTSDMIRRDLAGDHDAKRIDRYSASLIALNDQLTWSIQHGYGYLGDEMVSLARGLWDYARAWGHLCIALFNRAYADDEKQAALRPKDRLPVFILSEVVRKLLDDWLERRSEGGGNLTYGFYDYLKVQWLSDLRLASLRTFDSIEALAARYEKNTELYEALAQAIFLLAVEDLYPEQMARFADADWLNVRRLSLNPAEWDTNGIFEPTSQPGEFRYIYDDMRAQLTHRQAHSPSAHGQSMAPPAAAATS